MDCKVNHKFSGTINGVNFDDEVLYYSVHYILSEFEYKFNTSIPHTLIDDMKHTLGNLYDDADNIPVGEIEWELVNIVDNAKRITDVQWSLWDYGKDYWFSDINKKLSDWDNTYAKDDIIKK